MLPSIQSIKRIGIRLPISGFSNYNIFILSRFHLRSLRASDIEHSLNSARTVK